MIAQITLTPIANSPIRFDSELRLKEPYQNGGCDPMVVIADSAFGLQLVSQSGTEFYDGGLWDYNYEGSQFNGNTSAPQCLVKAESNSNVRVKQVDDQTVYIRVNISSLALQDCGLDPQCDWYAKAFSSMNGKLQFVTGGLAAGQNFNLFVRGRTGLIIDAPHEGMATREDTTYLGPEIFQPDEYIECDALNVDQQNGVFPFYDYVNDSTYKVIIANVSILPLLSQSSIVASKYESSITMEKGGIGYHGTSAGQDTINVHFNRFSIATVDEPSQTLTGFKNISDVSDVAYFCELYLTIAPSTTINNPNPVAVSSGGYGFPAEESGYPASPWDPELDDAPPPPWELDCVPQALFSVDIGGDKELSDPNANGNEELDPGDIYNTSGTDDSTAIFFDDLNLDGTNDPVPNATQVIPVCDTGQPNFNDDVTQLSKLYLDIDGFDYLDIDLSNHNFGFSGDGVIPFTPQNPSQCIHRPDFPVLSFDEDVTFAWQGNDGNFGQFLFCDVPINPSYPKGMKTHNDEVFTGRTSKMPTGFGDGAYIMSLLPLDNESDFAPTLAPNPQPLGPQAFPSPKNDDVDGLDVRTNSNCDILYFTVDHEARAVNGSQILDPGVVYQFDAGTGNIIPIIEPADYFISNGVDLNAFEFAWISTPNYPNGALGMVFSVDVDDEWTFSTDESGGNQTTHEVLYYSLLAGDQEIFADSILYVPPSDSAFAFSENIDALSFACNPLPGLANADRYISDINLAVSTEEDAALTEQNGIVVYPNPINQRLHIDVRQPGNFKVDVLNTLGQVRFTTTITGNAVLPAAYFNKGISIIRVTDMESNKVAVFRVMK